MAKFFLQKRQYVLLGLAFILLLAVIYRYAPELPALGSGAGQIAAQKERLIKYQKLKEKKSRLEKETAELDKQLAAVDGLFLQGDTPALAAVDLQNRLKKLAAGSGIDLESIQVIRPSRRKKDEVSFYQEIPVKINFKSTIRHLKEMLYSVADSGILLRVTDMTIKVDSRKEWQLNTEMTVTGLKPRG